MLKFTYTETSFYLERLALSVEEVVATRVILAMRVGQSFGVETINASFLLPTNLPGLKELETLAQREAAGSISICLADEEYVEVSLRGSWLATNYKTIEGVFVTSLSERTEFFLVKLWQEAQSQSSCVRESQDW